jgi:YVTN family beta-propeller protein
MRLFRMNFGQTRVRLVQAGAVLTAAALVAGCGNNYRPTVTPINTNGPAPQVTSYAAVVSAPSPTTPGIATIIDYSGDSIMAGPIDLLGVGPTAFTMDASGTTGYTINADHTLTTFPISTTLQEKSESYTTLATTAQIVNLFSPSSGLWAADLCATDPNAATLCTFNNGFSGIDIFTGSPATYLNSIPLPPTPVMMLGSVSSRYFAITQGNSQGGNVASGVSCNVSPTTASAGEADGIETSYTISSRTAVGKCPVYAVESSDTQRLFVLNRGSDTITVINAKSNAWDNCPPTIESQTGRIFTCHPTLPLSQAALNVTNAPPNCNFTSDPTCSLPADGGLPTVAGPVYAEYNSALGLLVVANYDGNTISVIDVSLDEFGNDSPTFGTTYTIPVGNNPASVTVLADGSRAYVANQADQTVSIVNLSSHSVEKTLNVTGYPRTVVSTQNSTQGKVYVASPNSPYLTIIRTDQDIVDTTILVTGHIVDVRVSSQNGSGGNSNNQTRVPGYGQPCNLPPTVMASKYGANYTLANCQTQP